MMGFSRNNPIACKFFGECTKALQVLGSFPVPIDYSKMVDDCALIFERHSLLLGNARIHEAVTPTISAMTSIFIALGFIDAVTLIIKNLSVSLTGLAKS
ncbi:MAG: hypothetical protein FWG02_00325 [Holophagaceae bacterium]|nr:hypothetical protein [Holophagaceae bacterium]